MGLRGPRAAPSALKLAKGERRPSRVNYEEPQTPEVSAEALPTPEGLDGAGLQEWQRVGPMLSTAGALRQSDLVALEDYCRALTQLRRYESLAKRSGAEMAISKGYVNAVLKLRTQCNALRRELGLTPSSRSAIKAPVKVEAKDDKSRRYLLAIQGGRA